MAWRNDVPAGPWDPITSLEHKIEHSMERFVAKLRERQATVHTRVACPTCKAPVGERCTHLRTGRALRSPHHARLRADGIHER